MKRFSIRSYVTDTFRIQPDFRSSKCCVERNCFRFQRRIIPGVEVTAKNTRTGITATR